MPSSSSKRDSALIKEFRAALKKCEELYVAAARECIQANGQTMQLSPDEFVARMIDLQRGLVLKVFVEIAYLDWRWSPPELKLAQALFQHVWSQNLNEEQTKEALQHVVDKRSDLRWGVLVGPFERLGPFQKRVAELQTIIVRIANLAAKADGQVTPEEVRQLQWIEAEMKRYLDPIPLIEVEEPEAVQSATRQAIQSLPAEPGAARTQTQTRTAAAETLSAKPRDQQLAEVLAKLDGLIGLSSIKQEVHGLVNYLKMQAERQKLGLPETSITLHSVFTGNPGTGKTTVARLLGNVFGAMGILQKGHLIETDRSGLVAEYAGQTGPKTNKRIDEALDGVLFIDEAYSLVSENGDDPYGAEAVQTLLKRMEDNRHRLVVVLAGYPEPMERLLQSNPGLSSRFSRHFLFPDYTAVELAEIFQAFCEDNHYRLPALVRVKLLLGFQHVLEIRDEHFGNGRLARNVFERAISRLANRIARVVPVTRELLTTFQPEDIQMADVPDAAWTPLASDTRCFQITCPGCHHKSPLPQKFLGQAIRCKRCKRKFTAEWGDVLADEGLASPGR